MKYKHIQAAHEARMWIKEVVVPVAGLGIMIAANPETRRMAGEMLGKAKNSAKNIFKKK